MSSEAFCSHLDQVTIMDRLGQPCPANEPGVYSRVGSGLNCTTSRSSRSPRIGSAVRTSRSTHRSELLRQPRAETRVRHGQSPRRGHRDVTRTDTEWRNSPRQATADQVSSEQSEDAADDRKEADASEHVGRHTAAVAAESTLIGVSHTDRLLALEQRHPDLRAGRAIDVRVRPDLSSRRWMTRR